MASIITATTTSGLTQSADNSGVLQLASGVGNLVTVPSVTGTAMVSGNMPAFSAYNTGNQAITTATATKVSLQVEDFDTANCFNNTTTYAFTPNVAGYYQINGIIYILSSITTSTCIAIIFKNGSAYQGGSFQSTSSATTNASGLVSSVVYLNGTTDYVELYAYASIGGTGNLTNAGVFGLKCQFSGALVRGA